MRMKLALASLTILPMICAAASFDCSKAASLAEMLICNDAELSSLDDELGVIYQRAQAKATDMPTFRQQTKAAWAWREKNCQTKACMLTWYANRKAILTKIVDTGTDDCRSVGPIRITGVVVSQNLVLEPDHRTVTIHLLNLKKPICVRFEPVDISQAQNVMVNRFQLETFDPKNTSLKNINDALFHVVTVTGEMSTDNVTQSYAEPTVIDVKSLKIGR